MTTADPLVPARVRKRPGRPRVPGKYTIDKVTGKTGIFVKECENCRWPALLAPREFDGMIKRGGRERRSLLVRILFHFYEFKNV